MTTTRRARADKAAAAEQSRVTEQQAAAPGPVIRVDPSNPHIVIMETAK